MASLDDLSLEDLQALKAGNLDGVSLLGLQVLKSIHSGASQNTPASVSVGETLRGVPRQVGLAARYGIEGLAGIGDIAAEPLRRIVFNPALRAAGLPGMNSLSGAASDLATAVGLPQPKNADERVVGDATRLVAGAGGLAGLSRAAASRATGVGKTMLESFAANPGTQMAGAAAAGAAGGSVREAGGGPWEQFVASLAGGLAGGFGAVKAGQAANAVSNLGTRLRNALQPQAAISQADARIQLAVQNSGLDWAAVPATVKAQLRQEVSDALNTGRPLNEDALRRLLVFRNTGTTPTVGMLTQDQGLITREKNLAKTGANSTSPDLQTLPNLQNQNTAQLLRLLDQQGAARSAPMPEVSQRVIESLQGRAQSAERATSALYNAARDSQGRSAPLDSYAFTARASQLLDEANVGSFLPSDIRNKLNAIAQQTPGYEFNVSAAEQLKTSIAKLQRGASDGNVRNALGLVRQALEETPLRPAPQVNPGNLPAVSGTVPPSPQVVGQEAIDAFNAARASHRNWRNTVEANPALQAVDEAANPRVLADDFVQKHILNGRADDVRRLTGLLDRQTVQSVRDAIVRHLRDKATNYTDDITKFSFDGFKRALNDIGDAKLGAFFSDQEIKLLKDIRDSAKYQSSQPAGSAVNNSNSGALLLGRGLDTLEQVMQRVPVVGGWAAGRIQGIQQGQQLNPINALTLRLQQEQTGPVFNPLVGLLAAPGVARGKNDRGN